LGAVEEGVGEDGAGALVGAGVCAAYVGAGAEDDDTEGALPIVVAVEGAAEVALAGAGARAASAGAAGAGAAAGRTKWVRVGWWFVVVALTWKVTTNSA